MSKPGKVLKKKDKKNLIKNIDKTLNKLMNKGLSRVEILRITAISINALVLLSALATGIYKYKNRDIYNKNYINDEGEIGQGKKKYKKGTYEGNFKDGKKDGWATMEYANGDVYVGNFKDDKKDGLGEMTYANGDVRSGFWEDDKEVN